VVGNKIHFTGCKAHGMDKGGKPLIDVRAGVGRRWLDDNNWTRLLARDFVEI